MHFSCHCNLIKDVKKIAEGKETTDLGRICDQICDVWPFCKQKGQQECSTKLRSFALATNTCKVGRSLKFSLTPPEKCPPLSKFRRSSFDVRLFEDGPKSRPLFPQILALV